MPSCQIATVSYTRRVSDALSLLCDQRPPADMVIGWLRTEDERLQQWVLDHERLTWATGIGTIDAARLLADNTKEGLPELISFQMELLLESVAACPLAVRHSGTKGWIAKHPDDRKWNKEISSAINDGLAVLYNHRGSMAHLRVSSLDEFRAQARNR